MNEVLIKKVIQYKLNVINTVVELLPANVADEVKNIRAIILESVNEAFQEKSEAEGSTQKTQKTKSTHTSAGINSISIE